MTYKKIEDGFYPALETPTNSEGKKLILSSLENRLNL